MKSFRPSGGNRVLAVESSSPPAESQSRVISGAKIGKYWLFIEEDTLAPREPVPATRKWDNAISQLNLHGYYGTFKVPMSFLLGRYH